MDLSGNPWYKDKLTFQLNDGAMIMYSCTSEFLIDVNGQKKPNVIGKDIFGASFRLTSPQNSMKLSPVGSNYNVVFPGCYSAPYPSTIITSAYQQDCKTGSGWGCSTVAILNND